MDQITLGFLGCGKISSCMCRGYASSPNPPKKIFVSRRSEEKSNQLKLEFPELVVICDDIAELVQNSDVLFIGLIPSVAREILPTLSFRPDQFIVSMMAAVNYGEVLSLTRFPQDRIVRTVPLPSTAFQSGPILTYPANPEIEKILNHVGVSVACVSEAEMKPLVTVTGHISSFYELMSVTQGFLMDQGLTDAVSRKFVASFYSSLSEGAGRSTHSFQDMAEEAATPGGLNEQSLNFLKNGSHFGEHRESLEAILTRLKK